MLSLADVDEDAGLSHWTLADVRANHQASGVRRRWAVRGCPCQLPALQPCKSLQTARPTVCPAGATSGFFACANLQERGGGWARRSCRSASRCLCRMCGACSYTSISDDGGRAFWTVFARVGRRVRFLALKFKSSIEPA